MDITIINAALVSEFSVIFVLLLVSFALSSGLSIYSFGVKNNKSAFSFGLTMAIIAIWVLIKIISLFVISIETREILHIINIIVIAFFIPALLLVAIYHTGIPAWFTTKHVYILFMPPAIIIILALVSFYSNILFTDFKISFERDIPVHTFKSTVLYQTIQLYNYIIIFATLALLIRSIFTKDKAFRKQMILFVIGLSIPLFYDIAYLTGHSLINNYNLSPVFLSLGNCFLAWSILGYKLFKLIPVAHYQIINNMSDILIITNNEYSVIDINKSGELFFDCKKDKTIGISLIQFLNNYPEIIENFTNNISDREISIKKNEQLFHFTVNISVIGNEKTNHAKVFLMRDITERIKSETQIKRLSVAIEQAPVTVVITDLIGNIEYVNPAFTKITGYTADEAIGNNPRVLKGNTPSETFVNLWETVLEGNVWHGEFINKKKSGELYYEAATIAPIRNDKNEIINYIAIKNDISQRKLAEEKLIKSEENLKSAQNIGKVGHWEYNNLTNELFWSEQIYRIYEVSPLEFETTFDNVVKMFHPDDKQKVLDAFSYSIQNNTQFEIQHRIITPAGKIKHIIERSSTKYDEEGKALITLGSVSDITQMKQYEEELNSERVLLKSLIDSIPDLIFVKDVNGVFKLVNKAIARTYAISIEDVVGKTDYDLYEKSIADFFIGKDKIVMESGKSETNEERVTFGDGIEGWLETTKTPFIGADGKIQGLIGVSRDISQRRKNEDELRENRANLLSLVENTSDSIWAIDANFKIIFANIQFKNAFLAGYGVALYQGMNILEALPKDLKDVWKSRYTRALENERFVFEDHFVFGELHLYFEIAMNPILVDNEVIGVSVFSRDISERKMAENQLLLQNEEIATQNEEMHQLNEELQSTNNALQIAKASAEESEELFRQLMNFSPIYIYIKDLNLRTIRLSYNHQKLFGKPIYQLLGKTNEEIMPLEYAKIITEHDLQVLDEEKPKETEDNINEKIYTAIRFPILIEGKPRYVAGFAIDTTERKNAELKIQKQNVELIDLNATKDKFFSIIAHDLRNPFNAILGFSDFLVNNIENCSIDELKLFAENIYVSATMTYKLLENLLDWSRLQRGLVKADIKSHNLKVIMDEVVMLHLDASNKKFIIIENNIKENIYVNCDLDMTKTILRNMLTNAIKFTENDGTIVINANPENEYIEIQVTDNGVGIPTDKIPFLFSIEKNTSTKGTSDETGTGLGLLLCKELVESQGGQIRVKSIEGEGSTFSFTLKLGNEKEATAKEI